MCTNRRKNTYSIKDSDKKRLHCCFGYVIDKKLDELFKKHFKHKPPIIYRIEAMAENFPLENIYTACLAYDEARNVWLRMAGLKRQGHSLAKAEVLR